MQKKSIIVATISFLLGIVTFSGFAQKQEKRAQYTPEQRTEHRLAHLQKELTLTDDQKAKVKELILTQEKSRELQQEKMRDKNKSFNAELDKILTPEQREKRIQMMKERKEKMHENHRKNGDQ